LSVCFPGFFVRKGLGLKLGEVVALRSGNWNNLTKSGVFTLNFNWATTNFNYNVGVRAERLSSRTYRRCFSIWNLRPCSACAGKQESKKNEREESG